VKPAQAGQLQSYLLLVALCSDCSSQAEEKENNFATALPAQAALIMHNQATVTGSISPEVSCRLLIPLCSGAGWEVIAYSIVAAGIAGKELAGVGKSSDLAACIGLERNANTVKVTVHANRSPRRAQTKSAWMIVKSMVVLFQVPLVRDEL
jgi:hypothetical protein